MNPTPTIPVASGTIVVFSDLACPFAHVLLHRLGTARTRLGLDDAIRIDHHAFPIELLNRAPGTRHGSDSEIPVLGALEPDAGWQIWQGPDYHYPSTMLPAFEAVQAAKQQTLRASERLDAALRRAFWQQSRPIHLHHEILEVATDVHELDVGRLEHHLTRGTARRAVFDDAAMAATDAVTLSPHVFLPDGTDHPNPGISLRWCGDWRKGFPVITDDEPAIAERLLRQAAACS